MGAPSEQFLRIDYGGPPKISLFTHYGSLDPYVSFSYYMGAPRMISLHSILGPPDHFLRLLYGAPQASFFSYNMGALLRSLSLFTVWGPLQISFFVYYIGAPSDQLYRLLYGGSSDQFFYLLYGAPLRLVYVLTIWGPLRSVFVDTICIWGPPQVSFFAYYKGPPQISFFDYYMGPPSSQFLRLLYGGLLMPVSSLTMWAPQISFSHTIWGPLRSVS